MRDADLTVTVDPEVPPVEPQTRVGRRRSRWVVVGVILAALAATGLTSGGIYWASVELPPLPPLTGSTTLYYADGQTVLARLGANDQTVLAYEEILPTVVDVTVAAEDPEFWSNTGGPIARAVVRYAFDVNGAEAAARRRRWILAQKLEAVHNKEAVLTWYLNVMPFGRGTYGIEAAAQAYFGKSASPAAPVAQRLTPAEAMVLLALVRQPNATASDVDIRHRWTEIRDSLAEQVPAGRAPSLSAAEVSVLTYPSLSPPAAGPTGRDAPVGLVGGHLLAELTQTPGSPFQGWSWDALREGGYRITTTIDVRIQKVLEVAVAGSPMDGQPSNLQAAGVVVEPGTGRVLAYYGGPDPAGSDYAGVHRDEDGQLVGFGAHPPGTSFMVYTLAAALRAGHSLDSRWQWTPHDQPGRDPDNPVRNSAVCPHSPDGQTCSLLDSVVVSLDVPLYDVTASVGVAAVLSMARDLGITTMWTDDRRAIDLTAVDLTTSSPAFGFEAGIGQYPVTVLDQANAMATLAGGAVRAPAHFVRTVTKGEQLLYAESLPAPGGSILSADELADLTHALTAVSRRDDVALKTGNWGLAAIPGQNSDTWSIGYTSAAAAAIWLGNRAEVQGLFEKDGSAIWGAGLPSRLLLQVLADTEAVLG